MPRYREHERKQSMMVPIQFDEQIQPGTFEHAIDYLVDNEIDLSEFEEVYQNDETGAPAIRPAILLKIVLFAYSRGMISSRRIARACEENVLFMALSGDTRPHFTTIAHFISSMGEKALKVFTSVLTVCFAQGLIEKKMFAIDGCKISSNCSKEWSGTQAELEKKAKRIEESIEKLIDRHRGEDDQPMEPDQRKKEEKAVESLEKNAQAFGDGGEAQHLESIIDSVEERFPEFEPETEVFEEVVLTSDSGFNNEEAMKVQHDRSIDAYVADPQFRKRDPRFTNQQEYKSKTTDRKRTSKARKCFTADEFTFNEGGTLICPAGKPMKSRGPNWRDKKKGYTGRTFMGYPKYCGTCELRSRCMRSPTSRGRQVTKIDKGQRHNQKSAVQWMIEWFDTGRGRHLYSRRMGTVEPVFGDICDYLHLDEFTLRGKQKVEAQ